MFLPHFLLDFVLLCVFVQFDLCFFTLVEIADCFAFLTEYAVAL